MINYDFAKAKMMNSAYAEHYDMIALLIPCCRRQLIIAQSASSFIIRRQAIIIEPLAHSHSIVATGFAEIS